MVTLKNKERHTVSFTYCFIWFGLNLSLNSSPFILLWIISFVSLLGRSWILERSWIELKRNTSKLENHSIKHIILIAKFRILPVQQRSQSNCPWNSWNCDGFASWRCRFTISMSSTPVAVCFVRTRWPQRFDLPFESKIDVLQRHQVPFCDDMCRLYV